ncbi:DUF4013 domain-containing protein [Halohasta litorea]|uniref:DUF4013 domain-containing protein n=1 Tax=Halohasta litorea TaxID=869891 RepID=A0ABD6D8E5_9EURY|nr:DUF4013 domain-containing protein [Halohasta litorea]
MLSESLRVPYRADDAFGTILVGSVLTLLSGVLLAVWVVLLAVWPLGPALIPVVALPSLVMRGYLISVVEDGIENEPTVSSFVEWGSLVRAGSKSVLVSVLYLLPGVVLCGLAVGGVATVVPPSEVGETAQALAGLLILISGFGLLIYGLVYLYVRPAARVVFAATGSLRAALGVRRVFRLAASGEFLTGWLIASGLLALGPTLLLPLLVVAALVGLLSPPVAAVIVLVTFILAVGLAFVVRVSAAWSTGRGAAVGLDRLYPAASEPDPATDDTGVVLERRAMPELDGGSAEVDPLVQTGRTVDVSRPERSASETTAPEPTPNEASETVDHDAGTVDHGGDTGEQDGETAESADRRELDDEDDSGFVWGVDGNDSQ